MPENPTSQRRDVPDRTGELRLMRLLLDNVVEYAIFVLDPDGRVASWNPGAERLKGYKADEIIGQHYSIFYTEESRDAGLPEKLLREALAHGHVNHTGWRKRKDGSGFWADVVITALFDEGRHVGFAKVTRDRTEAHLLDTAREDALAAERLAVEQLTEVHRLHRDFIDAVAHDLQSPLVAIAGFAELLQQDDVDDETARTATEHIVSNTQALQDLIRDLRVYSGLASGRIRIRPEPIDLEPFAAHLLADMRPLLHRHEVVTAIEDVEVIADRKGLERVLRNLLVTAAQHTPAGTLIALRARLEDDCVVIEVEDAGPGMPEDALERIFERFEKNGNGGGSGLGLAIAKEYVSLHDGRISARSTLGEGSAFEVVLPRTGPA